MANLWSHINSLLLVVPYEDVTKIRKWREALKNAGLNVHICRILCVMESKKERMEMQEMSYVVFLSDGDFGLLGKLKHEDAKKIFSDRYDAIISIGEVKGRIGKAVSGVRKRWDVGINSTGTHDISLASVDLSPNHVIGFLKSTLEKLS